MVLSIKLFILELLMYLSFAHSLEDQQCQKYRITSNKYIYIPNYAWSELIINGDCYLTPYKYVENSYYVTIRNPELWLKTANSTLNLAACSSMIKPAISLLRTYLAFYDNNGMLKYIKVYQSESELAVNLKLLLSGFLQYNKTKLKQSEVTNTASSNELLFVGYCPAYYNVEKQSQSEIFEVTKKYDMNSCSEVVDDISYKNAGCLVNGCNTGSEKKWQYDTTARLQIRQEKDVRIIESLAVKEHIRYKPWYNSSKEVRLDITMNADLETSGKCPWYGFLDFGTAIVQKMWYKKVDESLYKNTENDNNRDIKILYRGLACDYISVNIYMDIYERASQC